MTALTLTDAHLLSLARLRDDPRVLPILWRARSSRNKALLAALLRFEGAGMPSEDWALFRRAFSLLVAVHKRAPAVVEDLLLHPRLGSWAAVCAADAPTPDSGPHPVAHLGSFAAAAAFTAGTDFSIETPVVNGAAVLPGVGCWSGLAGDRAMVRRHRGWVFAEQQTGPDRHHGGAQWRGVRTLKAPGTHPLAVEFDDLPPTPAAWPWQERTSPAPSAASPHPPSPSVPARAEEFQLWRRRFAAGFLLIGTALPELAAPMRTGLRSLIPLGTAAGTSSAATLIDAFGTWAMTTPADAAAAAAGLVHEFQHSKLGAVAELVPLVAADGPADLYSPWRRDPRPASGILHGVFAHAAVALLWLRTAQALTGRGRDAAVEHALTARAETIEAGRALISSGRLTPAGRRFAVATVETVQALAGPSPAH